MLLLLLLLHVCQCLGLGDMTNSCGLRIHTLRLGTHQDALFWSVKPAKYFFWILNVFLLSLFP